MMAPTDPSVTTLRIEHIADRLDEIRDNQKHAAGKIESLDDKMDHHIATSMVAAAETSAKFERVAAQTSARFEKVEIQVQSLGHRISDGFALTRDFKVLATKVAAIVSTLAGALFYALKHLLGDK